MKLDVVGRVYLVWLGTELAAVLHSKEDADEYAILQDPENKPRVEGWVVLMDATP